MELFRGDIYHIKFPYTFDSRYPDGKNKFVLVLQSGEYFEKYNTVSILLITSDDSEKNYETTVTIKQGTTRLRKESYVVCAQPYTVKKSLFDGNGYRGRLDSSVLDEVDEKLYIGLCMDSQNE
ncbi:hypothetical protein C1I60_12880 [Paenibacillus terrae]|uniref:MazF family transcriptional regulator n=1 Tax=Paenibacillus terrae TaxID=159743 RepID=A0A4U2PZE9_9BACL|nr:type II toxin-antitoxin system PemK/MazF family toxin [Paenibacillus terrae]TKH44219.1 hypothetical protein C1I60_12880 [Paenibacillus terrae]